MILCRSIIIDYMVACLTPIDLDLLTNRILTFLLNWISWTVLMTMGVPLSSSIMIDQANCEKLPSVVILTLTMDYKGHSVEG